MSVTIDPTQLMPGTLKPQQNEQTVAKVPVEKIHSFLSAVREGYTGQELFDLQYIGTEEICGHIGVTAVSVINKLRRFDRIKVGNSWYWHRTDELTQYLNAWKTMREGV